MNQKMSPPKASVKKALYRSDGWRCRYCQIEVIDPTARKRLVEILDPLGSTSLWGRTDSERHAALLNLSASYDHVEARAHLVTVDAENLVTSCWFWQFGKGAPHSIFWICTTQEAESPFMMRGTG
jgi:hypothetical protein